MQVEYRSVALRTRRYAGIPQRLEGGASEIAYSLTSLTKDSMVMEIKVWDGFNQNIRQDSTTTGTLTRNAGADLKRSGQGIMEIKNGGGDAMNNGNEEIRIRKLTPKECYRLMAFSDADHEAVERAGISATQRYKTAGNSICVNVLEAIFGQLIPGKEDLWKEHWG